MSEVQNSPQSDSVNMMMESLTAWFEAPVAPVTPDSELDAILDRIIGSTEASDVQEDASRSTHVVLDRERKPARLQHDRFSLVPIFDEWIDSVRAAIESAVEFAASVHTLLPLTDWQESGHSDNAKREDAAFHMVLQDYSTERKVVLEAMTVEPYMLDGHASWTFRLLKQHETRRPVQRYPDRTRESLARDALAHLTTWTFRTTVIIVACPHDEIWDASEGVRLYDIEMGRNIPREEAHSSFRPPESSIILMYYAHGRDGVITENRAAVIDGLPHVESEGRDMRAALTIAREQISKTLRELIS